MEAKETSPDVRDATRYVGCSNVSGGGLRLAIPTLILSLLLPGLASAHPFGKEEYSVRTAVRVSAEKAQVVLILEVPVDDVLKGVLRLGGGARVGREEVAQWDRSQWSLLARDVTVQINGKALEPTDWKPVPSKRNGKAAEGFFVYLVGAEASVQGMQKVTVEVDNSVYMDKPMYLAVAAEEESPWFVSENSAMLSYLTQSDSDMGDEASEWSVDPSLRELKVVYERVR